MATEKGPDVSPERDRRYMAAALSLAERGLGTTAPNPSVGCILVDERMSPARVLARGATGRGGRPHAEAVALERIGAAARGATAYVTLEPCAHHGETPPCAEALIRAGVSRVVMATDDPDPRVAGRGRAALKAAGITVMAGVLEAEAREINAGFFLRVREGRPLVTYKVATSLDGRIASHSGASRWITREASRRAGHLLRATHDAIMIGSNTALVDDPDLTCRLEGLEARSPIRIVADSRLRLPLTAKLVREAKRVPTWVLARADTEPTRRRVLEDCGVTVLTFESGSTESLDMSAVLKALGARGLTRVLVEGGAELAATLMRAGLIDRIAWFRGNLVVGGDGIPAVNAFGAERIDDAPRWRRLGGRLFGDDVLDIYAAAP